MRLLLPLFPLLGYGDSPAWCGDLVRAADARGDLVYDVRVPFSRQPQDILDFLATEVVPPSREDPLRDVLGADQAHDIRAPLTEHHVKLFDADHFGSSVVSRDMYVLARASIVIVDANLAGFGEHMVMATYAHLLGCPVWMVNDRLLLSPFLAEISSLVVSSSKVTDLLMMSSPETTTLPAKVPVTAALVDPFDDGMGDSG